MIMKAKKTLVNTKTRPQTPIEDIETPKRTPQKDTFIPSPIIYNREDMKDLFFIVKGQFRKGVEPSFINTATGDVSYVGGYNPESDTTENWYMCLDKVTFHCVGCGSDLKKVLHGVYTQIVKHKGQAKKYFKYVSDTTSDDYYETHYLGSTPLDHDQRAKKAEGRCPRTSPPMRCLYEAVYNMYGHYYDDFVEEMEDLAFSDLEKWKKENNPLNKTKKRLSKAPIKKSVETLETPVKEVEERPVKKLGKMKPKFGVKKLVPSVQ